MPLFSFAETIFLDDSDKNSEELFILKEVKNPIKKTEAIVEKDYYAIFIKNGVYIEVLGEGKHQVVASGERSDSVLLIYVAMSKSLTVKWATLLKFDSIDRASIGMRGELEVKIGDLIKAYKELYEEGTAEKLQTKLRNRICNEIQPIVAKTIELRGIQILDDGVKFAEEIGVSFSDILLKDYGLKLVGFTIDKTE